MLRRSIISIAGGVTLGVALPVLAQPASDRVWRVGFLSTRRPVSLDSDAYGGFPRGMRDLGYVEGENLLIEWRFGDGAAGQLPEHAAALVKLKVDAVVTPSTPTTSAMQKATSTIPIVMGTIADPVGSGFVASLARPGGNITGLTNAVLDLNAKYLQLLRNIAPNLRDVAVLLNPDNSSTVETLRVVQIAAKTMDMTILPVEARTGQDIGNAFSLLTRNHAGAVIITQDPLFVLRQQEIGALLTKNRILSIGAAKSFVEAGALVSYGPDFTDIFRRTATFVDKILRGAKPADLPVEQPTKFEFVINLKTAKTLGLSIPQSVRLQATEVIE